MRKTKSTRVARTSEVFPRLTLMGSPFIALFNGVERDLEAGRMMAACRSLPTIFWKILIAIEPLRRMRLSSVVMSSALAYGSWTVRQSPSTRRPRSSLVGAQRVSPFSSFFNDIESLPPVCPDTPGAGKVAWVLWRAAREMLQRSRELVVFSTALRQKSSTKTPVICHSVVPRRWRLAGRAGSCSSPGGGRPCRHCWR
jgi:hypothetical protein